jgi:uncharacterized protein YfaS (alpha-2-macroglobulin family)
MRRQVAITKALHAENRLRRVFLWLPMIAWLVIATAGFDSCGADGRIDDPNELTQVAFSAPDSGAFDLRVLGRPLIESGSHAAFRLATIDAVSQKPVPGVHTRISVAKEGSKKSIPVFAGYTNEEGSIEADFTVPDLEPGNYLATFTAAGGGQTETLTQTVRVERHNKLYLTTDKPLYQPGQTIYMRALALSVGSLKPLANQKLEFVVEDGKGNKVFREQVTLNRFGVASAVFSLASEVNMGNYKIKAEGQNVSAEKTVSVERYVLPKYKVEVSTDKPFYRPSDTIVGRVSAQYLFGKPVSGASVDILGRTPAAGDMQFFSQTAKTDANGIATFEAKLPPFLVGHPLLKGKALLSFSVTVEDSASHREQATRNVTAGENALVLDAFVEGGSIKPGLPNTLFVIVADGAGNPAKASVTLSIGKQGAMHADTSELGVATFTFSGEKEVGSADISAITASGEKNSRSFSFDTESGDESLALVMDKAIYRAGDTIAFQAFSTRPTGSVFVDLVRDGQTVLTTTGKLENGRVEWLYDIPADAFGLMTVNAYFLSGALDFVRDTRRVMIQPAGDLDLKVEADKKQYKPGETAQLTIHTNDSEGNPTAAAVGLYIVDEAVFARAEQAPGLEKVFFLLEKEIMTPRWQITSFVPDDLVRPMPGPMQETQRRQEAGRALFAAMETPTAAPPFQLSSRKESTRTHLNEAYKRVMDAVARYNRESSQQWQGDTEALFGFGALMKKDLVDPWDTPMKLKFRECWGVPTITLRSAGPDGSFDSTDDLLVANNMIFGWLFAEEGNALPTDERAICNYAVQRMKFRRMEMAAGNVMEDAARPMAAPEMEMGMAGVDSITATAESSTQSDGYAQVSRVREYFPETLFVEPSLITDENGLATQEVPIADSITTWRVMASGSDESGHLGSYTGGLVCFQDFFIDPDLPLSLTAGDEISLPVAVYNYLGKPQDVKLELKAADWFELLDDATKTLTIGPGDVTAVRFRIRATKPGVQTLEIHGRGTQLADAVRKQIEVTPNGFAVPITVSDMLEKTAQMSVSIPNEALDGGTKLWLRLYPGALSEVIDGMDKMLQMPSGCFEQTSSTTYPNLLVLDYMRSTGKITPEIQMKAETLVAHGYQRLLTFEVNGGGFEWFGQAPANKILTAYGLLEFTDMSRVRDVDADMLRRTRDWLLKKQESDGRWTPDASYLHAESWSKIQGKDLLVTAYIAWALAESGLSGAGLNKAVTYLKANVRGENDPYILGLVANALLAVNPTDADGQETLKRLIGLAQHEDGNLYWKGESTVTYASGISASIETTGVAVLALLKSGKHHEELRQSLRWLIRNKDSYGTWHSTQGTIYVLKALLRSQLGAKQTEPMTVNVVMDDKPVTTLSIDPSKSDLMHQVDLGQNLAKAEHKIELSLSGGGPLTYQVAGRYYLPWSMKAPDVKPLISLDVDYDRTELAVNETVTCTVTAKLNAGKAAKMVMLDVGIPPGFTVETDGLVSLLESGALQRFSQTPRQVLIYLDELLPGKPFTAAFKMRARYPLKASIPENEAYLYYDPASRTTKAPKQIKVRE